MATSPDYLRLASSAARALADSALDALRDAVLVIDPRVKHLPVVLANRAACDALRAAGDRASPLLQVPLLRLLDSKSIVIFERALAELLEVKPADGRRVVSRVLGWRFPRGSRALTTELTLLPDTVAGNPGGGAGPSVGIAVAHSAGGEAARGPGSGAGHSASNGSTHSSGSSPGMVMLSFAPVASEEAGVMNELPFDVLILDAELRVTYANASALRTASAAAEGLVGRFASSFTPTAALRPEIYAQALEGRPFRDDMVPYLEPGKASRWFELSVQRLDNAAGFVGLVVLSAEVTERRMRSRRQAGTEGRLLALTEHARDIITVADPAGQVQYVSGGVRNSLGYTSEERRSNSLFEHMHPEELPDIRAKYAQLVAGEIESFSKELRVRHKDGSYRWLESSYASALHNPLIGGVVVNSRDITERKQAEFKLAQREEVFRLAADAVDGIVFEWDIARGVVHRSRGVREVLGIQPDDLESSTQAWMARIHPRDHVAAYRAANLGLLRGRGWTVTYRVRDAYGCYKSILERVLLQRNAAGDPVRAIGTCVDVSEIKRLSDILAESQRIAKIGGWEYSCSSHQMTWTDELYRIFDATPAELTPSWQAITERCVGGSAARMTAALQRAGEATSRLDIDVEISTLKGRRLWVRVIGNIERLDGRAFRAFGSVQDIQAQKLSQIALENSTEWLKLSMNMAHLHAWRWEKTDDTFEFTTLEGKLMRLPGVYPGMAKMISRVHINDQATVRSAIERAFEQHVEVREEFQLQGADGRYRAYASTARPLFDASNAPIGLVGVIQDITLRRDSERRLRQSEELLRTTTANTVDTLILLDTSLRVRFVNRGVDGCSVEDIIGKEIDVLVPAAARVGVLQKLRRILETGETVTYVFESHENGVAQYIENHAVVVREDGIGSGISISMRDITERKRLEQEILDVSARERNSIGRDLHDGLGQELTGLALMLRGLATRIRARCPDVVESVDEVVALVNQSIDTARSLSHGLLPVRTESGGLAFALRALAARGRDLYGMNITFRGEVPAECQLNETSASHLYRIAQEALTNAARHGRASRVDIELQTATGRFALRVTDDGVGFALPAASTGMGLKIMQYRASMIGAKFEVGANEPHGTRVTVTSECSGAGVEVGTSHYRRLQ